MNIKSKLERLEKQVIVNKVNDFWKSYQAPFLQFTNSPVSYPINNEEKTAQKKLTERKLQEIMNSEYGKTCFRIKYKH